MRICSEHIELLKRLAVDVAGPGARLRLFGSLLDDRARGDDVDPLLEVPVPVANPAGLAARLSARASRRMNGRKVDVVLCASNLRCLPIHKMARRDRVQL